jgi:methyl-accepting chemotaxis protein
MLERRRSARSRIFKNAKLIIGKSSAIDCVVRNLTNVGARVVVSNTTDLPERLEMTFDSGQTIRPCRIVWRTQNETGMEFCS